jgi:PKD repeat protein
VKAAFTGPDTVCVNDTIFLNNTSLPAPQTVSWNFGNGKTSIAINANSFYTSAGTYTIKLVGDFGGCKDSITKDITVIPKPQPKFDASQKVFCSLPATVNFTNQTTGGGITTWDFGDGTTSTQNDPSHTYSSAGNYTVSLLVRNQNGCSEITTQKDFIQVDTPRLTINNLPKNGCAPITIQPTVTVHSNHTVTGYLWKFDDGTTSASATPTHTYTNAGTYNVTLVYTTSTGCTDSIVIKNAVRAGTKPSAAFSINPTNVCALQPVAFTDNSTGGADQWLWNFGDGGGSTLQNPSYQYSDTGWFNVQLIVFNNTCPDTLPKLRAVYIKPPIASFGVQNSCIDKYTKVFTETSVGAQTWSWNFGDGATSTLRNPTHTFAATGTYLVNLSVSNGTCTNSSTRTVYVIDENAAMTSPDTVICRNQTANFSPSSVSYANIAKWQWNFGDGQISFRDSSASHVYTKAGNFTASLIITDLLGCRDTATLPVKIYGPTANFSVSSGISCLPNNDISFSNLSVSDGYHPIVKWEWTFGDGTKDTTGITPVKHSYSAVGNYPVSLLIKDSSGCSDIATKPAAIIISQPNS